jgi:hypothetical protein
MNKNTRNTRNVLLKPSTTLQPSTTPPCDSYNWCGLKDLKEQLKTKQKTKAEIQSRIDQDYYEKNIKEAQIEFDNIAKLVNDNDNEYEAEYKKMTQTQKMLDSPHCFRNNPIPANKKACEKDLEDTIDFHDKEANKLFDKGQKLRIERRKAKRKLNFCKNREIKDLHEQINAQKVINALNIRIKGIEDSCDRFVIKPDCSKSSKKLFEKKKKNANKKRL